MVQELLGQLKQRQQQSALAKLMADIDRAPRWARAGLQRSMEGEDTSTVGEKGLFKLLGGMAKVTNAIDNAEVPGAAEIEGVLRGRNIVDVLSQPRSANPARGVRLGDPKRVASEAARENVPGVAGRVLGSTAEVVLDPATLATLPLGGEGVIANLVGRGTMSTPRAAAVLGASAVGAGVGNELGGTPGSILGGLGGGWAGLSRMQRVKDAGLRLAGRSAIEAGANLEARDLASLGADYERLMENGVYNKAKMRDGSVVDLVTMDGITKQIEGRRARITALERNESTNHVDLQDLKDNVDALENVRNFMHASGRQEIPVGSAYDFGRRLGKAYQAQSDVAEWTARNTQAQIDHEAFAAAMGDAPDYRFRQAGKGQGLNDLLRADIPEDVQLQLNNLRGLKSQLGEGDTTIQVARERTDATKKLARERFQKLLAQLPEGAKSSGRRYVSALIRGDEKEIAQAVANLNQRVQFNPELQNMQTSFDEVANLHRVAQEAEAGLKDATRSQTDLTRSFQGERRASDKTVNELFGKAASKLKGRLLRPQGSGQYAEGSPYMYRMTGLANKEGRLHAVLERVKPANTAREAIESGAAIEQEALGLREATARKEELLRQRQAMRLGGSGATREDLRAMRAQIEEADAEIARLKQPAKPVPADQLSDLGNKLVLPLDDAMKFDVFEPAMNQPGAFAREKLRDTRTVALLNDQTRLGLEKGALERDIEQASDNLAKLQASAQPTQVERELLNEVQMSGSDINSIGGDALRPELLEGYRNIALANEEIALMQSRLDNTNLELQAIEGRVANSDQALEATAQEKAFQAEFAAQRLAQAEADYEGAWGEVNGALDLGQENVAGEMMRRFKDASDTYLEPYRKAAANPRRMSEAAFQEVLDTNRRFSEQTMNVLPVGFKKEFEESVRNIERMLPDTGWRAAVRQMMTPYAEAERAIDPDAMRGGLGGFGRRVIMGTGFKSPEMEGIASTFNNARENAAFVANAVYHGQEVELAKMADQIVTKMAAGIDDNAAWARSVQHEGNILDRMRSYVVKHSKPIEDDAWQDFLKPAKDLGATPAELEAIHRTLSDKFMLMAIQPNLFKTMEMSTPFSMISKTLGSRVRELQDVAGTRGIVRNLLRKEFRDYAPNGRLLPLGGAAVETAATEVKDRSMVTDLLEIMRNAQDGKKGMRGYLATNGSLPEALRYQGGPLPLERMMQDGQTWLETMTGNLLDKVNKDAAMGTVAKYLKDPNAVSRLKRGEKLAASEWKTPEMAESWGKLDDIINDNASLGPVMDAVRSVAGRIAGSTIIGDLGYLGIQFPLMTAMSPSAAGDLASRAMHGQLSDLGFQAHMVDPENYFFYRRMAEKGIRPGDAAVFGFEKPGNIYELIPGLRKFGKGMAKLDKYTFDRAGFIAKGNAIKTLMKDVQLVKAMGKDVAQEYVDGIPILKDLHSKQDLWQSTNSEIEDQIYRLAENYLGGSRRSSTLLSPRRQAMESMFLFVPGFFRARAGLIGQATRALRNPNSPEGYLAASLIAREATFRLGTAAMIATATGTLPEFQEEVKSGQAFDPRQSGGMLKGPLGDGGYLGFSWGNQAPKVYAQLLMGTKTGEFNVDPRERVQVLKNFFEGRTNPAIGAAIEQIEGKDFFGRRFATPTERLTALSKRVLPMWIGNTVGTTAEQLDRDGSINPASMVAETAAQFLGVNYKASDPYEKLNNQFHSWQMEQYPGEAPLDWKDAPSTFKRLATEARPEMSESVRNVEYDNARRETDKSRATDAAFGQFDQQQEQYDQQGSVLSARLNAKQISPADFKEAWGKIQEDRADASAYLNTRLMDLGINLDEAAAKKGGRIGDRAPAVARALNEYSQVRPSDFPIEATRLTEEGPVLDSDIDWTKYKQAKESALAKYPPEVQAQVREALMPEDPNAQRLQAARSALDAYFDKIPKYRGLDVAQGRYVDFITASLRSLESDARAQSPLANLDRERLYADGLRRLAQAGKINAGQTQLAVTAMRLALDPSRALASRNPASIQWLLQNPEIAAFYPWMAGEMPSKLRSRLPRETTNLEAIQQQELRGTPLAAVR